MDRIENKTIILVIPMPIANNLLSNLRSAEFILFVRDCSSSSLNEGVCCVGFSLSESKMIFLLFNKTFDCEISVCPIRPSWLILSLHLDELQLRVMTRSPAQLGACLFKSWLFDGMRSFSQYLFRYCLQSLEQADHWDHSDHSGSPLKIK